MATSDNNDDDDTVYVAVGKDVEKNKSTLLRALERFPRKKFYLLHVHQTSKIIPLIGVNFPADRLEQHEFREFQEIERKIMHKILDDYLLLCRQAEIQARKLYIEMDDIGMGIVELIYHHSVKKLVMGAAADKHYYEGMTDLKSQKAKYVHQRLPNSCQVWYICEKHLILTREPESSSSCTEPVGDSASLTDERAEDSSGHGLELCEVAQSEEEALDNAMEGNGIDLLYSQLDQALVEAEKLKRQVFEESLKRGEIEKIAIKALCRGKALENMYSKELKRRKEAEEAITKNKQDLGRMKNERDEAQVIAADQRILHQIEVSDFVNQIKELQEDRDNVALRLAEELSKGQAAEEASQMHKFLSVFSLSEIEEATQNFNPTLKIGEGGYGNIYKGLLYRTPIAIKVLNQDSLQGSSEFKQEVHILSRYRHPNLITLIGACPEVCALIYEYAPNGNLEERLSCNNNTPPLPWQTRIRIATELCSALIFLHSSKPDSIVHGDLKPANILLDANLGCKLGDFGISRALPRDMTLRRQTDPKGTFYYLDPHFLATGELTPKVDTYSFGIILLQLLTGRSARGIAMEIKDVIAAGNLSYFLDPLAGDWPFVKAKQLARLGLQCCDINLNNRPDLASEVWMVLEPMRASCGSSSLQFGSQRYHQPPPSHFFCPILQEVMQDPQVAADGFTYEAEAMTGWLESGHSTSPMTNLELPYSNLVPNRSLRSAIQEWLQLQQH